MASATFSRFDSFLTSSSLQHVQTSHMEIVTNKVLSFSFSDGTGQITQDDVLEKEHVRVNEMVIIGGSKSLAIFSILENKA